VSSKSVACLKINPDCCASSERKYVVVLKKNQSLSRLSFWYLRGGATGGEVHAAEEIIGSHEGDQETSRESSSGKVVRSCTSALLRTSQTCVLR